MALAESIFTVYGKMFFFYAFVIESLTFYSSMRQSYDIGCPSSFYVQFHQTLLYTYTIFQNSKNMQFRAMVLAPSTSIHVGTYLKKIVGHSVFQLYLLKCTSNNCYCQNFKILACVAE